MNMKLIVLVVISIFLLGCGVLLPSLRQPENPFGGIGDNISTNGASIYYTGETLEGRDINYSGGTFTGMMMNQRLSCASCHGRDGSGGIHIMHMQVMDAPDIRLVALSGEAHDDGKEEGSHADSHDTYDLHTFESAVVYGKHPDGESLSDDMPRWQLSDQDLEDLFAFIGALE